MGLSESERHQLALDALQDQLSAAEREYQKASERLDEAKEWRNRIAQARRLIRFSAWVEAFSYVTVALYVTLVLIEDEATYLAGLILIVGVMMYASSYLMLHRAKRIVSESTKRFHEWEGEAHDDLFG